MLLRELLAHELDRGLHAPEDDGVLELADEVVLRSLELQHALRGETIVVEEHGVALRLMHELDRGLRQPLDVQLIVRGLTDAAHTQEHGAGTLLGDRMILRRAVPAMRRVDALGLDGLLLQRAEDLLGPLGVALDAVQVEGDVLLPDVHLLLLTLIHVLVSFSFGCALPVQRTFFLQNEDARNVT